MDVNVKMNLKDEDMVWIHMALDRVYWQALEKTVMNLRVP
jgi:hypothetical protein